MKHDFMMMPMALMDQQAVTEILQCNEFLGRYKLSLTQMQAQQLAQVRSESLKRHGRIEFGVGIIENMIDGFCDSPYINQSMIADLLCELTEVFYYYKNESEETIRDDDLILLMRKCFDEANGSTEIMESRLTAIFETKNKENEDGNINTDDFRHYYEKYRGQE